MNKISLAIVKVTFMVAASCGFWTHVNNFSLASDTSNSLTSDSESAQKFHDSEVIYQSPLYFCDEYEGASSLFIRSDLGNVPVIVFELEDNEKESSDRCMDVAVRLCKLMETKGVRFLTWWDKLDGNYEVKISESEGYAIDSDKHYLFTLKSQNNPGEVMKSLRGIASTYGGEPISVP
ncbi:MAG: COP23 domain-containing protein [Xenococcaceae cyanobacterium]